MRQHLIDDFIESALNPAGRLRTLDDVIVETDSRGCPLFYLRQREIVFHAIYRSRRVTFTIPTDYTPDEREQIACRAFDTQSGRPFLAEGHYFRDEILVFSSTTQSSERFDVLIQDANDPIVDFVRKNSARSKLKAIRTALECVAQAAETLDREGIVHGAMSLNNLCLDTDSRLTITDYPLSLHPDRSNDSRALLTVGIMLFLSGCEPKLYRTIGSHGKFTSDQTTLNRRHVASAAEFYGIEPLARALKQSDCDLSREVVNRRLADLAATPFSPMPLLCDMIDNMSGGNISFSTINRITPEADRTLNVDFGQCQEVAPMSDRLARYRLNDYWGYADRYGHKLKIDKPLLGAYDFYEGRAVARTADGYGLLDREGRWVMRDSWSDMIWYGKQNVVGASDAMGKWRLFNRSGEPISDIVCDALCDCNEGIIIARQGDKYGYIALDGTRVTNYLYDEAYGFSDGYALVSLGGRRYYIDRRGHEATDHTRLHKTE